MNIEEVDGAGYAGNELNARASDRNNGYPIYADPFYGSRISLY